MEAKVLHLPVTPRITLPRDKATFLRLNGKPPAKPNKVPRDKDGRPIPDIDQMWLSNDMPLLVVIKGFYPNEKKLLFYPYKEPGLLPSSMFMETFRQTHTFWGDVTEF